MIIHQALQEFRSYINLNRGIVKPNRFVVELLDPKIRNNINAFTNNKSLPHIYSGGTRNTSKMIEFSARSTSLPSKTLSTNAVEAPGPEQKYPYNDVYDDLTITFMVTQGNISSKHGIPEKRFFDAWMNLVVNPNNMLVNFSNEYATNGLHISMINEKNRILAKYRFDRAYPIGMGAVEMSHDSEEIATFEVTFSCDRWHYVTDTEELTSRERTISEPRVNNETLKTTSDNGAIPKRWNPKFATFGPQLPGQTSERGTLLESDSPYFIKPKTSGSPLERASNLAGKAAGKADQLASKVGVRVNPSRKVARTLAVAKKLKRFV